MDTKTQILVRALERSAPYQVKAMFELSTGSPTLSIDLCTLFDAVFQAKRIAARAFNGKPDQLECGLPERSSRLD